MIVVDSSVWIDVLHQKRTRQVDWLRGVEANEILVADLVLLEVLKGARNDAHADSLARVLGIYPVAAICGEEAAHQAARHFRTLRGLGVTLRRQVDLLIGSFCIEHHHELLHIDRDFDKMAEHLGLRLAAGSLPPH